MLDQSPRDEQAVSHDFAGAQEPGPLYKEKK
jgi:hypothetical protein